MRVLAKGKGSRDCPRFVVGSMYGGVYKEGGKRWKTYPL